MKAARQYQSAIGIYRAAKETVALAEDRLVKGGEVQLSSAWQEMLNHATTRVRNMFLLIYGYGVERHFQHYLRRSVLFVKETGVPGKKHRPAASH